MITEFMNGFSAGIFGLGAVVGFCSWGLVLSMLYAILKFVSGYIAGFVNEVKKQKGGF